MNSIKWQKLNEVDVLNKLKMLLGVTGEDKDMLLQFALDDTKAAILNYCNLTFIPKGLETIWLKMTIEFYGASGSDTGGVNVGSNTSGQVSSIKEGDVTVQFATGSSHSASTTDGIINNYIIQLNQFRKVKR
ncbi:MAG: hypothetical protein E7211_20530 [Clostridium lundense]|nr:hypothetical protein [Clostridium lundense]